MDTPFPITAWKPTAVPKTRETIEDGPSAKEISHLIHCLGVQTKCIYAHPYDPSNWLQRAQTLDGLLYPELTVGDATKASDLAAAHLSGLDQRTTEGGCSRPAWRLGHRMGFWMLDPADQQDEKEREMLMTYLQQIQGKAARLMQKNLYFFPDREEGRFRRRPYPWMKKSHGRRSAALIEHMNHELAENARHVLRLPRPTCHIKGNAFGLDADGDTSDILGVFAARDMAKGQTVLIDRTRTWGCNGPGVGGSRDNLSGGHGCLDPLHPNDQDDEYNQDLRWIRDLTGKHACSVLLLIRLLLCCVQDNIAHPLDHHLIARLTPTYLPYKNTGFSLQDDIVIPNRALQQLGIDIYANPNFDTWILFTIQARMSNNSCGDPMVDSLNPLFSMFNHSCEPNVEWSMSQDHRTITVSALRELRAEEQLFVQYDGYMADESLEVRRRTMWRWLAGPCVCVRCMREEEGERWRAARVDEKMEGKIVDDWNVPAGRLPILPEDLLILKKLE